MTLTTAMVSVRALRPRAWYGHVRAVEDLFAATTGATRHDVVAGDGPLGRSKATRRAARSLRQYTSALDPAPRRPADLAVMWASDLGDVGELLDVDPAWVDIGRTKVLVVSECWPDDLTLHGPKVQALVECFDIVVNCMENDVLGAVAGGGRDVHHLPHAAVCEAYAPVYGSRPVAVMNYGRRDPAQHDVLRSWADRDGAWYHYDTAKLGPCDDPRDHQRVLGRLLSSSAASVCNLGRFDETHRTGGASELGARFYESLAAGCLLLGDFPTSPTFDAHFADAPGMIPFPLGSDEVPSVLLELLADPDTLAGVERELRARALEHHDIAHRLATVLEFADAPVPPLLTERRQALIAEAAELRS